jgi:hypothetical protein
MYLRLRCADFDAKSASELCRVMYTVYALQCRVCTAQAGDEIGGDLLVHFFTSAFIEACALEHTQPQVRPSGSSVRGSEGSCNASLLFSPSLQHTVVHVADAAKPSRPSGKNMCIDHTIRCDHTISKKWTLVHTEISFHHTINI